MPFIITKDDLKKKKKERQLGFFSLLQFKNLTFNWRGAEM